MPDEKKHIPGGSPQSEPLVWRWLNAVSRYRVSLSSVIVVLLIVKEMVLGTRPRAYTLEDPWAIAGIALVLIGAGLRSWSAGIIMKSEALATTGPYALTRHPLYVGSLLLACGFLVIIGRPENALIVIAAAIVLYVPNIRKEERFLAEKFGKQWAEYTKQTAGIFPKRLSALKAVWAAWSFKQWVKNREYRCAATSLIALTALGFWPR